MSAERFTRSPALRTALWGGLSAGPVRALLWPVFVRRESGVWPASPLALTLAMLTRGTLMGLAAGFTVLLPVLSLLDLRPGPRLRRTAAAAGGAVCLVLTIVGALCGWLGAMAVPAARPARPD